MVNLEGSIAGAERSLLLLVKHLKDEFVLSAACPPQSPLAQALREMAIDCYALPAPPRRYRSLWSSPYWVRTAWKTAGIALKAKADIIHANSFAAGAASLPAALMTRKKLIIHARDFSRGGIGLGLCTRYCEKIIAVSRAVKNDLVERGTQADKIKVVYNGVGNASTEASAPDKTAPDNRTDGDNHEFVFAQVGQLVPWKNHKFFLAAAVRVAQALPTARFSLIGDDIFGRDSRYRTSLLGHISDSGIAEKVKLTGWQQNMQKLWPGITCLVHTAECEPFGRAIIEAMAHKVPVIAASGGGPSEIIESGKTGILVKAGDIDELSEAMLRIAQDNELAKNLGQAGYRRAISDFTAEKTAAQMRQIYSQVAPGE
jgi:glycosyltransferase involved in cell wall biosynthesis